MANTLDYSNGVRHAQNQALIDYAGTGCIIHIYDGIQPATANDPITTQVLLVSLVIPGIFGTDVDGTLTLGAVTPGLAVTNGLVGFFRITKADNSTVVMDGSAGIAGCDLDFGTNIVDITQTVSITSGTIIRNNQTWL